MVGSISCPEELVAETKNEAETTETTARRNTVTLRGSMSRDEIGTYIFEGSDKCSFSPQNR